MGAANVVPGVSGGTIALITGVFERLINALKSIDISALRLFFKGNWNEFAKKIDLYFLLAILVGVLAAIFSVARLFEFLFENYPVYIWSYFFGLIIASIYFVGITVNHWRYQVVLSLIVGTAIAVLISLFSPATENDNFFYLILCGIVAVSSMMLPGISGSFVLVLMGNYQLVAIEAVNQFRLDILFPVGIGIVIGLIAFSHFLGWIFKRFRDLTISLLTGFILGSLLIIWPWKEAVYALDKSGHILKNAGEAVIARYSPVLPESFNNEVIIAIVIALAGISTVVATELLAGKKPNK